MKKKLLGIVTALSLLLPPAAAMAQGGSGQAAEPDTAYAENASLTAAEQSDAEREHRAHIAQTLAQMHRFDNMGSDAEGSDISLMSEDTAVLSGTVTLPDGVTAREGDYAAVVLFSMEKDENGKILSVNNLNGYSPYSAAAAFADGENSASYSITAPKGSYVVMLQTYGIADPVVISSTMYYTEDGYTASGEFGEIIDLSADKSVDLKIPAAKHTISGTVTLPEPADEDIIVDAVAYKETVYSGSGQAPNTNGGVGSGPARGVKIPAGQTSAEYAVGLPDDGVYSLYVLTSYGSGYYSVYGTMTSSQDSRMYFDMSRGDVTGMDLMFTPYSNDAESQYGIPFTITLPEPMENGVGYSVDLVNENESESYFAFGSGYIYAEPGNTTINGSVSFSGDVTKDFILEIMQYSSSGQYVSTYYYSSESGITTIRDKATPLNVSSLAGLNIQFPQTGTISGTISRDGVMEGDSLDVVVTAGTPDGEKYSSLVSMSGSEDKAQYSVDIPEKYLNGSCNLQAEIFSGYFHPDINIYGDAVSVTFTDGLNVDLTVPGSDRIHHLRGTVQLSSAAPRGGLLLSIQANRHTIESYWSYIASMYAVPEGANSVTVDTYLISDSADSTVPVYVSASGADGIIIESRYAEIDTSSANNTISTEEMILGYDYVTVSGKVKLPDGVTSSSGLSYVITVYGSGYTQYGGTYNSIFKGESESSYSFQIPVGASVSRMSLSVLSAGSMPIYAGSQNYVPDGSEEPGFTVDSDIANADFTLERGVAVSGRIIAPDGVTPSAGAEAYISAEIRPYEAVAELNIPMTGRETPYSLVLPPDYIGDIKISYSVTQNNGSIDDSFLYYVKDGSPAEDFDSASVIEVNGADVTGIDLKTIKREAGIDVTGGLIPIDGKLYGTVTAKYIDPDMESEPKYILAVYENGVLTGAKVSENGVFYVTAVDNLTYNADSSDCKIFVWDERMTPCCEPVGSERFMAQTTSFKTAEVETANTGYIGCRDENGELKEFNLQYDAEWFVNGCEVQYSSDFADKYIYGNYGGEITLKDFLTYNGVGSDGVYDSVNITYYTDAVVDEVTTNNDTTEIALLTADPELSGNNKLVISPDKNVTVTGAAESLDEIEKYDVLSVKFNPVEGFENSDDIEIIVSRDCVLGTITKIDHNTYSDGARYYFGNKYDYPTNANTCLYDMEAGTVCGAYIDAFGYIAYMDEYAAMQNYGIIDGMYAAEGGSVYKVRIIAADGERHTYNYYRQDMSDFLNAAVQYAYDMPDGADLQNLTAENLKPVQDRVITYLLTAQGNIRIARGVGDEEYGIEKTEITGAAYSAGQNTLGDIELSGGTNMLDISDYIIDGGSEIPVAASLKNGVGYNAYAYSRTGAACDFLLVTNGETNTAELRYGTINKMYFDEPSKKYKIEITDEGGPNYIFDYQSQNKYEFMFCAMHSVYNADPIKDISELADSTLRDSSEREVVYIAVGEGNDETMRILMPERYINY